MELSPFPCLRNRVRVGIALVAAATLLPTLGAAAQNEYWSPHTGNRDRIVTAKGVARESFPQQFKLFDLTLGPLSRELHSVTDGKSRSTVISLPNAAGQIEQFEVFEASNFEPDLQARFPEIRAFSGKSVTDPSAMLKLSLSPQGISTTVFRSDRETEIMEAYSADRSVYAVYRRDRARGRSPWSCSTQDRNLAAALDDQVGRLNVPDSNTGQHRTVRLAQSCNGEYSNYFGATSAADVNLVLDAFNATLTRSNGVYEKDLALHLNLIANTTAVIFYDPLTDPYSTLGNWNNELQATLTSIITDANYDIGHMFGASGGGGNAGCIGCICNAGVKGRGITSPADAIPEGDNFDIDYVVHEVGHQIGGNHSFSFSSEGPGPAQKEVASGITIMGYAGITNQDVAPHSIDTFHETNIQQIQTNLGTKTCPVTTAMDPILHNAPPVVAPVPSVTIPISTPFELTGSATDPNGDTLTYQWEQNDNLVAGGTGANSVASPTKVGGPNWLSFLPTASPTRTFPRLQTLQAGLLVSPTLPGGDAIANIEAASSVSRTLNFRLTVRDNHAYTSSPPLTVGQTQFVDTVVTVSNTSGPFAVTAPNTPVSWNTLSTQTVTWNVANTTAAPVSCPLVDIRLSTDSGATFPTVLAAGTPNDGSEAIIAPGTPSPTARVRVKCANNIFFDISNTDFTIAVPVELMGFEVK